ncbi:hypothetical protein KC220_22870, partial [Mycobacterium tuberculosis]|nr:hypothetical protein [Mycobacterium tuberculosis]
LADAANYLRDTVGLVESGDLETAWETSTRVSRIAGEALLGAYGDYYHADKFMLRRLRRRTETSVIAEQFADALYWPTGIRGTNAELIDAIE